MFVAKEYERLTELFNKYPGRSYLKVITFPVMVRMIGDALLQERGPAHRAFGRAQEEGDLETETHKKRRYVRRITLFQPDEEDVILVSDLIEPEEFLRRNCWRIIWNAGGSSVCSST